MKTWLLIALLLLAPAPSQAQEDPVIAQVTRLKQGASLNRGDITQSVAPNMNLHAQDRIITEAKSRLEITFKDGTTLTLGENSSLTLDQFVYDPTARDNALHLSMTQGAFLFVSGLIGKSPQRDISVTTPIATIGVRGTTFWGGALDNPLDVLLLDGKIEVQTPEGSVLLDKDGEGTSVPALGAPPLSARIWPEGKRSRAFATVAF